ncbi:hypothetical protein [Roseococcus sp. YIM B11640]|uniref:hypothetical protein n=1 Tax=Roseococcus sp. YIM B11640 TaxID=3133973 RepID=UPI003C7A92B9
MAHSLPRKIILYGFVAGVLAMAAFHQGTLHIMHHNGAKIPALVEFFGQFPRAYVFAPGPFGLPQLAFLLILGGLWGIVIAALLRATEFPDLPFGFLFGAIVVTAVDLLLLPVLMGRAPVTSPSTQFLARAVLLNGAFGFGAVFFMRPFAVRG